MGIVDRVWAGEGTASSVARGALWPASAAWALGMTLRAGLYAAGVLRADTPVLPAISVGNLTVGGTGKTPFAAWLASRLAARARPALVLRGYGDDEVEVHRRLNPGITVVANPDRAEGAREARARGADIVVLDDAFQHRRVRRVTDIVLVAVEQLLRPRHVLPAGPWREPLSAARRADVIVLTRKSASDGEVTMAERLVAQAAPGVPVAVVHLAPRELQDMSGHTQPLDAVRGRDVLAIAAVGEPDLFRRQLEGLGARVALAAFRDHYHFSEQDILRLSRQVPADGAVVCTLKDAVKLAFRWPGPMRLWYVSQHLVVEKGAEVLDGLLERALDARAPAATTAG